jgi:hypothetical protein
MSELPDGTYVIRSAEDPRPIIGVDREGGATKPVITEGEDYIVSPLF